MFSHWEYLEPLRKHRSFVFVFMASAIMTALALTYVYSEKYEATVTLVLAAGEVTRLQFRGDTTEAFGAPMPQADFKIIGKTLEDLVGSERLLRQIVDQFDLDVPEERVYDGPWYIRYYEMAKDYGKQYALDAWAFLKYGRIPDENPTAEAVKRLAKDVKIHNQDSYVFFLKVRDKNARRAAAVADAMAQTLVVLANEADTAPASERRRELEALRATKIQEIESDQRRIDTLLSENRLTSVSQEMQEGVAELYALQAEHRRLLAGIEAEKRKLESLEARLASVDQITRRDRERDPAQPNVERLQSEDIKKMISDKLFSEVELDGMRARRAALESSIAELNAKLEKLPVLKLQIDQLESDLDRANREYEQINVAVNELVVAESENVAQFRIQHAATEPTAPVTPIKVYHVGLAALLGVAVSVGLVYVLTYFNVRVFIPSGGIRRRRPPVQVPEGPPTIEAGEKVAVSQRDRPFATGG